MQQYTRFNVVGSSGSGKSTIARAIAQALRLPYVELDALFWKPDWQESSDDEFLPKLARALAGDQWVLDGNYSRTTAIKWQRVEVVVWLDLSYWLILYQLVKRSFVRSLTGEILWSGNTESLVKTFFRKDSVIWWSLTNLRRVRRGYSSAMNDPGYSNIRFVRLQSPSQVRLFLKELAAAVR